MDKVPPTIQFPQKIGEETQVPFRVEQIVNTPLGVAVAKAGEATIITFQIGLPTPSGQVLLRETSFLLSGANARELASMLLSGIEIAQPAAIEGLRAV